MADTDLFPVSDDTAKAFLAAPDVAHEKKPQPEQMDLLPTRQQYEKTIGDLTKIQEKKTKSDSLMQSSFEQNDKKNRERMERLFAAQGATIDDLKPWNAQQELADRKTDLWEQFGSPGFIVAMLASSFSAMPMNSALESGAAAMNAINQGDMLAYNRAFDSWKENTRLTIDRQKMEHELYDEADKLRESDMAAWRAKVAAVAARFDDKRKLALLQNGMDGELITALGSEAQASAQLAKARDGLIQQKLKMDMLNVDPDWKSGDPARMKRAIDRVEAGQLTEEQKFMQQFDHEHPDASFSERLEAWKEVEAARLGARAVSTSREDALELDRRVKLYKSQGMSDTEAYDKAKKEIKQAGVSVLDAETIDQMARQYLAGDKSVFQNLGRGAQGAENVVRVRQAVEKIAKDQGLSGEDIALRVAEFNALTAGERTLGTRTANVEMFVNEARNQMQVARKTSLEVPRGEFVPINRALLAFQENTGDPKVVAFGAAINTLVNTYAKAIAGGGQATVSDKDHARDILKSAYTSEQFDAVLKVLDQEMEAAREAPRQVKQQFRDLAHSKTLEGIPTPPQNVIKYDADGKRIQ